MTSWWRDPQAQLGSRRTSYPDAAHGSSRIGWVMIVGAAAMVRQERDVVFQAAFTRFRQDR